MAIQFAADSYAQTLTAVATARPITMAGWFHADAGRTGYIASLSDATSDNLIGLVARGSDDMVAAVERRNSNWSTSSQIGFTPGGWRHAAAVFSGTISRRAFVDGGAATTETSGLAATSLDRTLLRIRAGATDPNDGFRLAEVAIWRAALATEEIALLASGVSPLALRSRLGDLALYRPLYRTPNESFVGPTLSLVGSASHYPHPRTIPAQAAGHWVPARLPLATPYRRTAGGLFVPGAAVGATFVTGSLAAATHSNVTGE